MVRYRAGIVGLTGIGAAHPDILPDAPLAYPMPGSHAAAYAVLPQTEIVAYCDLNPALLEQFHGNWGGVWPEARAYTDYREMLADARLDLLSVCTSDDRHADLVVDACAMGVRGLFCEKPIATSLQDADRMIHAAERAGVVLSIDHTRRWWSLYRHVQERIREGDIGLVRRMIATLGGPRAMLFRNGTHLVDTVLMMVESDPEWVVAALDPGFEDYHTYRGEGGRNPALDPGGSALVQFRCGARAFLTVSKTVTREMTFEFIGERGRITVSDREGAVLYREGGAEPLREPRYRLDGIAAGLEEVIRCLEGTRSTVASPPREARKSLEVLLGILRSQALGNVRVNVGS